MKIFKIGGGDTMRTYLISDTHFGHTRIIELTSRPFLTVEEMDKHMIDKWNSVVTKQDHIICLGDFSFYNKEITTSIVGRLKGIKTLLMGNHDHRRSYKWWREVGFDKVYDRPVVYDTDNKVVLSHAPISIQGYTNIHGHTHNTKDNNNSSNSYCVSVEMINYTPIMYEDVLKRINYRQRNTSCIDFSVEEYERYNKVLHEKVFKKCSEGGF
jgi:calcineurin-like phosphoesterase family protein